ncbi:hypothetical protein PR048_023673 [Dryococelus australis]|uniref:DDE Tnp4 domain-containing protein n=1 Tax=Dryococelus australis TaxID=614101 RepID=A0ABQ9GUT8_9NEOP|nr:hypothetical protein PR048_023673 [Dryococelus australis]
MADRALEPDPGLYTSLALTLLLMYVWAGNFLADNARLSSHQGEPDSIPGQFTQDFRKSELCLTIPLVGGFSRGSPVNAAPYSFHFILTGSQDLALQRVHVEASKVKAYCFLMAWSGLVRFKNRTNDSPLGGVSSVLGTCRMPVTVKVVCYIPRLLRAQGQSHALYLVSRLTETAGSCNRRVLFSALFTPEILTQADVLECEKDHILLRKKKLLSLHLLVMNWKKRKQQFHNLFPDLLRDKERFFKYFRMSSAKFVELFDFFLSNLLVNVIGFLPFRSAGLGDSTVRKMVYETCDLIWETLATKFMPTPSREQWQKVEEEFLTLWHYPNCIGAVDGKHPSNSCSLYFNYKKEFSIVLLAVVDAEYRFNVDVGAYGRNSDGGIFRASKVGQGLINGTLDISPPEKSLPGTNCALPHVIVGDRAFPLLKNVMRPCSGAQLANDESKKIYNYRHSRARRCWLLQSYITYYLRDDACAWQIGELEHEDVPEAFENLRGTGGNNSNRAFNVRESWQREEPLRNKTIRHNIRGLQSVLLVGASSTERKETGECGTELNGFSEWRAIF